MAGKRTNGSEAGFSEPNDAEPIILGTDDTLISDAGESGIPSIDPATISYEPDPDEQPRKRGRKPGSKNRPSATESKKSASDLTALLLSIHMMAAAFTKIPELILEEEEANKLGQAMNRVNELYGGMVIPEKWAAWGNLAITAGAIYGPRFVAHNLNAKNEKAKQPVTIDAQVIH